MVSYHLYSDGPHMAVGKGNSYLYYNKFLAYCLGLYPHPAMASDKPSSQLPPRKISSIRSFSGPLAVPSFQFDCGRSLGQGRHRHHPVHLPIQCLPLLLRERQSD